MARSIPAALATLLFLAPAATAAPMAVQATLRVGLGHTFLPFVTATGTGTVSVTGGGKILVPAGLVSLPGTTIPVTSATGIGSLQVSGLANQSGTFSVGGASGQVAGETCATPAIGEGCVGGGGLGGAMGLTGTIAVHIIPHVAVFPLNVNQLLIGQGGSTSMPFSADAAPWTTSVGRLGFATTNGSLATSSTVGTHAGGLTLTLVTATYIAGCGNLWPTLSSFQLTALVPEPGVMLLLGLGAAGLALALRCR